jgi:hypothetical protein
MALQLKKASRQQVKIKMQIGAASGAGKTYGALKLAHGITDDWSKIAVIDTENDSSQLYVGKDEIGEFNVVTLKSYTEKDYIEALKICEDAKIEVCIIDTSSRLWDYLIELQSKLGGRYQDWKEPKAKHKKYLYAMLGSNMHIISTVRKKEDYSVEKIDGKTSIKKIGLKEQQEANMNYEFTTVFDVDQENHTTTASKDRTGLFTDVDPFLISEETGRLIKNWCEKGNKEIKESGNTKEAQLVDALLELKQVTNISELIAFVKENLHLKEEQDFKDAVNELKKTF